MKYILYSRKSTEEEDRQILSIETQKEEILKRFPDLEITRVFEESKSAFKPYNRPLFAEMMKMLQEGKADGIAAWDPSRLSRNPIDAGSIIHFLDTGIIKDLKFGTYHFDNSPEGKMMLQFALSQSKYSSDKLSKDVKRGMIKKCVNGWRPNLAPTGYMNDIYGLKGEKKVLVDLDRFHLVRKMWDLLLTGIYNPKQILEIANEDWGYRTRPSRKKGGTPLVLSAIYKIFNNPFYYGEYRWDGEWRIGKHEPMITKEEFDRAQLILGRRGKPRPHIHRFAFTGMIRCGTCGYFITAEQKLKRSIRKGTCKVYNYYRCVHKSKAKPCHEKAVREELLEEQIQRILETLEVPKHLTACTVKYLNLLNESQATDRAKIQDSLLDAQKDVSTRMENLIKLYISPQNTEQRILTEREFIEQKDLLMNEKEGLISRINDFDQQMHNWMELTAETFKFASHARYWFEKGSLEEKKAIFLNLGHNFLLHDQKLTVELSKPFMVIKEGMEKIRNQNLSIPPVIDLAASQKTPFVKIWSGLGESNPCLQLGKLS